MEILIECDVLEIIINSYSCTLSYNEISLVGSRIVHDSKFVKQSLYILIILALQTVYWTGSFN